MSKTNILIINTLSFRLLLRVLIALATLLMAALLILFIYSRRAVKEEALQEASQTLEATVQNIDNILLSVEQATGNVYWKVHQNIHQPKRIEALRRKLIEANPYISNCIIDLTPADNKWYADIAKTGIAYWTDPHEVDEKKGEWVTSFCLPVFDGDKAVGVMAVDVPLTLLSKIVLETKPSPNSYCTLLGRDGSFIVHPDSTKLTHLSILAEKSNEVTPSVKEAARAMVAGETGYRSVNIQGKDCYVFYKPFKRSASPGRVKGVSGWSAGIIYPEDDIFGDYNSLLYLVLAIVIVGLLLLFLLCQNFIRRQLQSLRLLTQSAQHIAEGNYDEPIPDTRHIDEIGRLQRHFQEMQQSLSTRIGEMAQLTTTLEERGATLQATYDRAQEANRMKVNFLSNMTNQMTSRVRNITTSVKTICSRYDDLTEEGTQEITDQILHEGEKITDLLNQLIINAEKKKQ